MSRSSAAPAVAAAAGEAQAREALPLRSPLLDDGPSPLEPGCADCDTLRRHLSRAILTADRATAGALREQLSTHHTGTHARPTAAA